MTCEFFSKASVPVWSAGREPGEFILQLRVGEDVSLVRVGNLAVEENARRCHVRTEESSDMRGEDVCQFFVCSGEILALENFVRIYAELDLKEEPVYMGEVVPGGCVFVFYGVPQGTGCVASGKGIRFEPIPCKLAC